MPMHPARARRLLAQGRAVVAHAAPFVIRLKDRTIGDGRTTVQPVGVGVDPGSKHTGVAVFAVVENINERTGEVAVSRRGMFAAQLDHRSYQISQALTARANLRRGRRSRNLRYRQPRVDNRTKPKGWLAPSLQHRVDGVVSQVGKLVRWFPVTEVHQELVRFDNQALLDPEIAGTEYQQGTLFGTEVREYLLAKFDHTCVYCDARDVALNIDHVRPRARGGSNRVSNLVLACVHCNQDKAAQPVETFVADPARLARILARTKKPLRDAAAVNSTRWALHIALQRFGVPVHTGTGGRTKWNRTRNGLPKTHAVDALAVGEVDTITSYPGVEQVLGQTGRGSYQRTHTDKYGFPRGKPYARTKRHFGFQTGDLVRAVVPSGKYAGTHTGRVMVRKTGTFDIKTRHRRISINHRRFTRIQHGNGWSHHQQKVDAS